MVKMERFTLVNNSILDFTKYSSDFLLLQNIVYADLKVYFLKLGFKAIDDTRISSFRRTIKFYNMSLDMELAIKINKRGKTVFV
ncbi:hypothetical protein HYX10_04415 [Candidatus Woesearchaeota archaeon]|nr:hypothetical protein [Candidatus Woesearchaeota archaeon]